MATHSSILAWKIHGQKSLTGYSPWGCKEQNVAGRLTYPLLDGGPSASEFSPTLVITCLFVHYHPQGCDVVCCGFDLHFRGGP